jgi:hypothetical protein
LCGAGTIQYLNSQDSSYAKTTKISVAKYLSNLDIHHNFHTPISPEAAQELTTLNQIIIEAQGNHHNKDTWTYIWGTSQYSSSKFYRLNFASIKACSLQMDLEVQSF